MNWRCLFGRHDFAGILFQTRTAGMVGEYRCRQCGRVEHDDGPRRRHGPHPEAQRLRVEQCGRATDPADFRL